MIRDAWIQQAIEQPIREEVQLTAVFVAGRELPRLTIAICE